MRFTRLLLKELLCALFTPKTYLAFLFLLGFGYYMVFVRDIRYSDLIILFLSFWLFNNVLLDSSIFREKISGKFEGPISLGYTFYTVVVSKILFILLFSAAISTLLLCYLQALLSYAGETATTMSRSTVLIALLVDLAVLQISTLLYLRFDVARPVKIVLVVIFALFAQFKDLLLDINYSITVVGTALVIICLITALLFSYLRHFRYEDL